jgi:ribonuclease R
MATQPGLFIIGKLELLKSGRGFVFDDKKKISVGSGHFHGALHGDQVKVKIIYEFENKINGEIVEVLIRSNKIIQGNVKKNHNRYMLEPSFKLCNRKFYIVGLEEKSLEDFCWVEAEIIDWVNPPSDIPVRITKIIGDSNNPLMDLKIITSKYGIPRKFPKEVIDEVNNIKINDIKNNKNRINFTNLRVITIDPKSAKDHDDAISIKKMENGFEIGVHIADVAEIVKVNTKLDIEAFKRGTSVYLVDQCIPMLPEEISNGICSLKENEERLSLSLMIKINKEYEVISHTIFESIIKVKRKYSYSDIISINKDDEFFKDIKYFEKITNFLRKKRIASGSFDFNIPEPEIEMDGNGIPVSIKPKKTLRSHNLIEELMLLANKIIAREYGSKFKGFQFRNHETPQRTSLLELKQVLIQSNIPKEIKKKLLNNNINLKKIFNLIKGLKAEKLLEHLALRAMSKANYSPKNAGHYGLGFKYYCHFTSPIRRYPDLIVHRFLKSMIHNSKYLIENPKNISIESSMLEVKAMRAEREFIKRKQLRFLNNFIGNVFQGIISGANPKGFFVQLNDILVDGFVSLKSMTDDYYLFNRSKLSFYGRRTKQKYHIGDIVEIKLLKVNIQNAFADFEII